MKNSTVGTQDDRTEESQDQNHAGANENQIINPHIRAVLMATLSGDSEDSVESCDEFATFVAYGKT